LSTHYYKAQRKLFVLVQLMLVSSVRFTLLKSSQDNIGHEAFHYSLVCTFAYRSFVQSASILLRKARCAHCLSPANEAPLQLTTFLYICLCTITYSIFPATTRANNCLLAKGVVRDAFKSAVVQQIIKNPVLIQSSWPATARPSPSISCLKGLRNL